MAYTDALSVTVARRGLAAFAGRDANRVVVVLRGDHDVSTVAALGETLARAIALDDADLVVDLNGVRFMDAATLSVIVRAREFLRRRSRSLTLRSPSRCATRVLDLCDLGELVDPGPVDTTRMTGAAGALGTWVAVPTTDRADRPADGSSPDAHQSTDERTTILAGRRGP